MTNAFSLGKTIKKDTGSSKTSTEVKKPTGVKIKTKVEAVKPKVSILLDLFISYFLYSFKMMKKKRRKSPL